MIKKYVEPIEWDRTGVIRKEQAINNGGTIISAEEKHKNKKRFVVIEYISNFTK